MMLRPRLLPMLFALLGAAQTQAQAQTATVYGIVDQAIEVLSHTAGGGGSLVRLPNLTGSVPSRFGLRGSEDLGGGLKALFALESGFATDTGTLGNGGRFWGRHAYVALAGGWGQLSLGRLPSATFLAGALEPLGGNLYSNASLDGYIPNARSDNSLGLQTRLGSLSLHATYSLGRDTVNGAGPAATNCPGEAAGERRPAGNGRSWRATMVRAGAAPWPWTGRTAARAPPWAWATAPIPIPAAAPTSTACWARPA